MRLDPIMVWLAPAKQAFRRGGAGSLLILGPAWTRYVVIGISMRGQNSPVAIGLQGSRLSDELFRAMHCDTWNLDVELMQVLSVPLSSSLGPRITTDAEIFFSLLVTRQPRHIIQEAFDAT